MISKSRTALVAVAVLALCAGGALAGKKTPVASDTPRYDASSEYVVKGTVTEVKTHTSVSGYDDTHVMMSTSVGEMEVHVGPTSYLTKHGFQLQPGDQIVLTCSKVSYEGTPVLVAREIERGKQSLTLRNTSGQPAWPKNIGQ
jgi:molybdopterin biosynthesis enzyme